MKTYTVTTCTKRTRVQDKELHNMFGNGKNMTDQFLNK